MLRSTVLYLHPRAHMQPTSYCLAFKHGNYLFWMIIRVRLQNNFFITQFLQCSDDGLHTFPTLRPWSDIRISKYRFFKYETMDGVQEPINAKLIILPRCYPTLCCVTEIIWIYFIVRCYDRGSWSCGMWHNVSEDPVASLFGVELCCCEFPSCGHLLALCA
jgi:hypothetical protein